MAIESMYFEMKIVINDSTRGADDINFQIGTYALNQKYVFMVPMH